MSGGFPQKLKRTGPVVDGLGHWLMFGVLLTLVPIGANALDAFTRDDKGFHFEGLFERGELLLVASAVVCAALADLYAPDLISRAVATRAPLHRFRRATTGFAALVLLAASVWFADIQAGIRDGAHLDHHRIAMGSIVVFALALVVGASCVALAHIVEEG